MELMMDLAFVRAYIDDLLIITQGKFREHLEQLEQVLERLSKAGLKVNMSKNKLARTELEYLRYWITRQGIKPLNKKVEAINNLSTPKTRRELRKFIGLVNYYRYLFPKRSKTMALLTALTYRTTKWKWAEAHQLAFDNTKK